MITEKQEEFTHFLSKVKGLCGKTEHVINNVLHWYTAIRKDVDCPDCLFIIKKIRAVDRVVS